MKKYLNEIGKLVNSAEDLRAFSVSCISCTDYKAASSLVRCL